MGTDPKEIVIVMVTAPNQELAARISDQAVRSRQAACATIVPMVNSIYWWEGRLVSDQEVMILLKTTADNYEGLQETIQKIHSYKVPEIIAIPVAKGLPQYLEWVQTATS